MKVLALSPYHGGSHQSFLEGWRQYSRHRFTVLTLPARHWKWRMRHAAVTLAEEVRQRVAGGEEWDVVFATDMFNLAEFCGFSPACVGRLPCVLYFHENQLTYPDRYHYQRDLHFGFTNLISALAAVSADRQAETVWFNSDFHRQSFLAAAADLLQSMPDFRLPEAVPRIRAKAEVQFPGIEAFPLRPRRREGPLRILWAARWEHDKAPETFFHALEIAWQRGCEFRLNLLGQSFGRVPACFEQARRRYAERIDRWSFLPDREDYRQALMDSDVVVSTARHEFFGIAVAEAVRAGCCPLVPRRLAYPEVLGDEPAWFHDETPAGIAYRLQELSDEVNHPDNWLQEAHRRQHRLEQFARPRRAEGMDQALEELVRDDNGSVR